MAADAADERSPRYPGWRVVFVCFSIALFAWGFAFYGHGIYLAELGRLHGWSTASISLASTLTYLLSAALLVFVSSAMERLGPRVFLLLAIACMAASALLIAAVSHYWQLVAAYLLMAFGWAGMGVAAISTILGRWFSAKRGLAISLALNGASLSGVVFIPPLVALAGSYGLSYALSIATGVMLAILIPLVLAFIPGKHPPLPVATLDVDATVPIWNASRTLLSWPFWSVTAPFALAIAAQAGFLVHQIAYLSPIIGREQAALAVAITTAFAVIGRLGLGIVVDRLNQRCAAAASFGSQTLALGLMAGSDNPAVLLVACAVYGFSVGNIITIPALIIQREFDAASFGRMVGLSTAVGQFIYAFGPGVVGLVRDASGTYAAALIFCGACNLVAAVIILLRPHRR